MRLAGQRVLIVSRRPGARLWLAMRLAFPLSLIGTTMLVALWAALLLALR